ncbi:TPA: ABC transporter ATP-binding protein, partial [Candidatus Bathyarchaeota archaeon]|nr:ABC transporter ATP-binding protein [Candidatus Bathyarchaeota archaeon]
TLIRPTSGMAKVFGLDVERENSKVRKIISYLPEEAGAYRNLSGLEYLEFMANFYSKDKDETESMVEEAAKISGLRSRLKDKVKTYSKGMTRRLLVARALMIHPKLAILDEPTSGLDVVHAIHVRRIIQEYVKKHNITVLLSSHNMLEVEFLCDRISLINNGKILAEGTPHEIKSMYNSDNLEDAFIEATKSG